jgi:hypothetical protein
VAASDPERCRENALKAVRARHARTAPRRAADKLNDWAERYAAALEPFAPHEAAVVGHMAAVIDARVSGGSDAT